MATPRERTRREWRADEQLLQIGAGVLLERRTGEPREAARPPSRVPGRRPPPPARRPGTAPPDGRRRTRPGRWSAASATAHIHQRLVSHRRPTSSSSPSYRRPAPSRMSNSSISRRAPGRPSPRPPPDEKPSSMARSTSGMPGPSSTATTTMPLRRPSCTRFSATSPSPGVHAMLRATSEIAVAMRVRSVLEKPSSVASRRPSWRAVTMSSSRQDPDATTSFPSGHRRSFVMRSRKARPSSRSSAVCTPSSVSPSCTIAKATSG